MGFKDVKGLSDISNGVVEEQFAKEWETVLFNIADPSTEPKAKRKITIEIAISPNENRSTAVVSMKTK